MMRISPRVDFAFKLIFESHKDLLMGLINAIVSKEDQVQDIVVKNPYTSKKVKSHKFGVLDIKAQNVTGTWYNIEVQVAEDLAYDRRALYYWSKVYADQLQAGEPYKNLQKTISIHVLNFNVLEEESYHNIFHITNDKTGKWLSNMMELHFIELPKVSEDLGQIKTALDRWAVFLARAEKYTREDLPIALSEDRLIQKAMGVLESTYLNEEQRETYEGRLKWLRDEQSIILTKEKKAFDRGIQKGIEKGMEKGEFEAKKTIARHLKEKGIDMAMIQDVTGLSIDVLKGLS